MQKKIITATAAILVMLSGALATANSELSIVEGEYVCVKDGHLSYAGKQIKLWGTNFVCNVKQKVQDLPLSFDRMRDAGFNAVRLNLFSGTFLSSGETKNTYTVPTTVKGSDSLMDRLDYSVYLAKQRGMFFWFTFSREVNFTAGDYDVMADDGSREQWQELIKLSPSVLVYLDERAERAHQEYAKAILEHINPYTGKRYADEETVAVYEIFNENGFVEELISTGFKGTALAPIVKAKWNEWLRQQYVTTGNLVKAWGKLCKGESLEEKNIDFAPVLNGIANMDTGYQREFVSKDSEAGIYPHARGADVARFACDMYIAHTQRFMKFVRSLGKGIAVVPITPTGRYGQSLPAYYAAASGDFISNGLYGFACRAWSIPKDDPLYPFLARVNEAPMMEQPMDITKVAGKPYLYYEVNDYRPNPYTVEFAMRMAMIASQQGVDGVFWFNWDADGYLPPLVSDSAYVQSRMPMPDVNYPNAGLILANDEVALAAIKSAGAIFLNGYIPAAKKPRTATIGGDVIFDLSKSLDSISYPLRYHAWRDGVQLTYAPKEKTKLPAIPEKNDSKVLKMGSCVTFDWRDGKGFMQIDSPQVRARVGFNGKTIELGDTKIEGVNQPFTSVVFVSEDGRPLEESTSVLVTMLAKSTNTGFVLDPSKMKQQWAPGLAEAVVHVGEAPVVVDRVAGVVKAKWLSGMSYAKYDFGRRLYAKGVVGESLEVGKDEPMFYCRLSRLEKPRIVKKMLVIGNSITRHGPSLEQLGWNGDWGMAATSADKDFVHVLHRFIAENQQSELSPELKLGQIDEMHMTGYEEYLSFDADLIVIELGDNFPVKDANEEKFTQPYRKMVRAFRDNNENHPLIVCVGTWGNDVERNSLIQKVCQELDVMYVPIGFLALDGANMAKSEGHFTNAGVNWHPGDRGMQRIAETLWSAIKPHILLK